MNNNTKSIISAVAVLLVSVLGMFGLTIEEETAEMIATGAVMLVFIVYGIVRDHNFKPAELVVEKTVEAVGKHVITAETVDEMLDQSDGHMTAE